MPEFLSPSARLAVCHSTGVYTLPALCQSSLYLYVCLPYPSLSAYLSVCHSACLLVCQRSRWLVCLPVCMFVCSSAWLSADLHVCLLVLIVYLWIWQSTFLFVCVGGVFRFVRFLSGVCCLCYVPTGGGVVLQGYIYVHLQVLMCASTSFSGTWYAWVTARLPAIRCLSRSA